MRRWWRRTGRRRLYEFFGSDRHSFLAMDDLDRKIRPYLDFAGGVFIEAGANDGLAQSNTYWFERFRGWTGLLIEPVPALAEACRRNRPRATVVNSALAADDATETVTIRPAGLMSLTEGAMPRELERRHLDRAAKHRLRVEKDAIQVPARTLRSIIREAGLTRIDLLSLDVEGYEVEAIKGLGSQSPMPRYLLAEIREFNVQAFNAVISGRYRCLGRLSHHDYLYELV